MKLTDALFNWLQIAIVSEARPMDKSAKETVLFFEHILKEDHGVTELTKEINEAQYVLHFLMNDEKKTESIFRDSADKLLQDILAEPKYN